MKLPGGTSSEHTKPSTRTVREKPAAEKPKPETPKPELSGIQQLLCSEL